MAGRAASVVDRFRCRIRLTAIYSGLEETAVYGRCTAPWCDSVTACGLTPKPTVAEPAAQSFREVATTRM